jgi:radical SAM superfamily enzyme YgiQ (UPF0313 family)
MKREKILLALLPFWSPLIPPLGIACLKSHLQNHGYDVRTADANTEDEFVDVHREYLNALKEVVPRDKRGNFMNIANDVLQNHLMAHLNYREKREHMELVKVLVYQTFFIDIDEQQVSRLDRIVESFYHRLKDYFLRLLAEATPTVLGLSVYNGSLPASLFAFKLAKEIYPEIKTVMGGGIFAETLAPGSPNMEFFLEKTPYIDHIVVGEGEILLVKLLKGELAGTQRVFGIKDIAGEILDMASADIPDFSDLKVEAYPNLSSYASRSCPFQCSFCSEALQWGRFRKKGSRQIVAELTRLYQEHGSQLFLMGDSLLNPVIKELAKNFIESGIAIYWDGYLRADRAACDTRNTLLWRRAGFYRARLGVESGSPRVLELMGKKISVAQIKDAVFCLAHAGIKTTTCWVIGHPGETEEDFQQTLDLIEELKGDIYEADCNPFTYYFSGQTNSEQWANENKRLLLYPQWAKEMLLVQTWIMDKEPRREEIYRRLSRFAALCRRLGIPNPYTLNEIYQADERWQKLHKNAVPPLIEFQNRNYIDECKHVRELVFVPNELEKEKDEDFGF